MTLSSGSPANPMFYSVSVIRSYYLTSCWAAVTASIVISSAVASTRIADHS